jgi:hypothetical protein
MKTLSQGSRSLGPHFNTESAKHVAGRLAAPKVMLGQNMLASNSVRTVRTLQDMLRCFVCCYSQNQNQ